MKKEKLIATAKEMQRVLNFAPEDRPPLKGSGKQLTEWIEEASSEITPEDLNEDGLNDETLLALKQLGFDSKIPSELFEEEPEEEEEKPVKKTTKKPVAKKKTASKKKVAEEDTGEQEKEEEPVKKIVKKQSKAIPAKKGSLTKSRIALLTPLIKKGKFTKKELIDKALEEEPGATSGIQTLLTDGKNPKYNKFEKLIVQDKTGIMSFE